MEERTVIDALAALAQEHRLRVFRLLMLQGPEGMPAGRIAESLGVPASTLSSHLAQLERAGLLRSRRDQRRIIYSADFEGTRRLLRFLTEDCCGNHPEICGYAVAARPVHDEGDPAPAERPYHVLFLCTGNSARSIMAECALNRLGGGRFRAFSAGSHPRGAVHPTTLELLRRLGHDTSGLRSKSWDEFARPDSPPLDLVVTVCDQAAGEVCPIWPGGPMTAHWGVPDPAAFVGPDELTLRYFESIYLELERRIRTFIGLPVRSLDRSTLQRKVNEIGNAARGQPLDA